MQKWEYIQFSKWLSDTDLNLLGAEGWELAAYSSEMPIIRYIFKRPKV
jgi:hypothetical protein